MQMHRFFWLSAIILLQCCWGVFSISLVKESSFKFKDCGHVRSKGFMKNGTYTLWMNDTTPFKVHCEHGASTSYTMILRRQDGSLSFYQPFQNYQNGFGHPQYEYWAGLNAIYYLTYTGNTVLTINMQDWHGNNRNVRYSHFSVSPAPYFQLNIFGFQGDVPDDLSHNNRANFATYDRPDPNQCAAHQKGGWWYNYCTFALPTGQYYPGGPYTPTGGYYDGIYWKDWLGYGYSLKFISMTLSNA